MRKTAIAVLSLKSIGWHRVCSTLALVARVTVICALSRRRGLMIGVRVRVHPHGTPLEREGVRRSNAKNESGLLPKFQNDLSVSSYCIRD